MKMGTPANFHIGGSRLRGVVLRVAILATFLLALFVPPFSANADSKDGDAVIAKDDTAFNSRPGQITARQVFVDLPVSVLDILSRSTRLDMLDYYDVDSLWQATNSLGGPSVLERVTPDYLSVRLTPVSTLQVCLLPRKKGGPLVMTLYTIGARQQAPDTEINFFDSDLKPVEASRYFKMPELKEFFDIPKGAPVKMKELEQAVSFPTVAYVAIPGEPYRLLGRLTVESSLSQESKELIAPYLRKGLEWSWDGKKFSVVSH